MWILVHFIYCCTTAVIIINITLLAAKVLLLRSVPNLSFQVPQLLQLTGGRSIADSCRNSRAGTCLCKSWPTKSPTPSGLGASFPLPDVHYMTWACQEKTRSPAVPLGKCQTPGHHLHPTSWGKDIFLLLPHILHWRLTWLGKKYSSKASMHFHLIFMTFNKAVHDDFKPLTANWVNVGLHRYPSKQSVYQTWLSIP